MRYELMTGLSPDAILKKAVDYFGNRLGLNVLEQAENVVAFGGPQGEVSVSVAEEAQTTVAEVVSRELASEARTFLDEIRKDGRTGFGDDL